MNSLLRRLSIRSRMAITLLLAATLLVVLSGWSRASLQRVQARADQALSQQGDTSRFKSQVTAALERIQRLELSVLLNGNNSVEAGEHQARWTKEVADTSKLLAEAGGDAERARRLAAGAAALKAYAGEVGPVLQQVVDAKMDSTAGYAYANNAAPKLEEARAAFSAWQADVEAQIASLRDQEQAASALEANLRLAASVAVMAAFATMMMLLARTITQPLSEATDHARRIARGDLSTEVKHEGNDEVAAFMRCLAEMQAALRRIVGEVRSGSENIHTASSEVASGNMDLSHRTEQAASSLQETAASMEELTSTVRRSAEAAAQANEMAAHASDVARRGGEVVAAVVSTMDEINASSRKISDIIGVIDGIAFQTNILALNAAVEAARAGEQGRGFAVVAGEVRSLAGRSAEAAREIKSLINASVERVDGGTRLVREAGSTMEDIVGSVHRVSGVIQEITGTSSNQSQGLGQINAAISQLDHVTQQNAALVEEGAAAAESLKEQAHRLVALVADFKLNPAAAEAAAPAAAPGSPNAPDADAAKAASKPAAPPAVMHPPAAAPAKPVQAALPVPAAAPPAAHEVVARDTIHKARKAAAGPAPRPIKAETLPELNMAPTPVAAGRDAPDGEWETF